MKESERIKKIVELIVNLEPGEDGTFYFPYSQVGKILSLDSYHNIGDYIRLHHDSFSLFNILYDGVCIFYKNRILF